MDTAPPMSNQTTTSTWDNKTTTPMWTKAAEEQSEEYIYSKFNPPLLILSIAVILQNSLVIHEYFPERRKLTPLLFLLIASADMIIAGGVICNVLMKCN